MEWEVKFVCFCFFWFDLFEVFVLDRLIYSDDNMMYLVGIFFFMLVGDKFRIF